MRMFKKLVVLLVAVLAVALFIVGFWGVSSKYGDISSVYVNGVKGVRYDVDFATRATIVFSPKESGEDIPLPTPEELDSMKTVMETRMEMMRLSDYSVSCDYDNGKILVEVALNSAVTNDFEWFLGVLGTKGEALFYKGNPETVDEIEPVFTGDNLVKTTYNYEQDYFATYHILDMKLDRTGRAALRETTTALKEELDATEEAQYITLWYNGSKVNTIRITNIIKNGKLTLRSSSIESATLNDLMVILNSGSLVHDMSYELVLSRPAAFGENALNDIGLALLCGFGAVILYLLVRFRLIGLAGIIATAGTLGFAMFFVTGFMLGNGIVGTLAAFSALLLLALVCIETTVRNGNAVRHALRDSTAIKAVPLGMKSTMTDSIIIYSVMLLLAVFLMLCGSTGVMASLFQTLGIGSTGMLAIGTFGSVLIAGIPAAFVFSVLGGSVMVQSLMETFKKSALYGGGKA